MVELWPCARSAELSGNTSSENLSPEHKAIIAAQQQQKVPDEIFSSPDIDALWAAANIAFLTGDYPLSRSKCLTWMWRVRHQGDHRAWGIDLLIRLRMARGHFKDRKTLKWCQYFSRRVQLSVDLDLLARKNQRIGFFHFFDGRLNEARQWYSLTLKQLQESGHQASYYLADHLINLGICERYLENYPAAISHFQQALTIGKKRGLAHALRKIYRELAYCYFYQGKYRETLQMYELMQTHTQRPAHHIEGMIIKAYLLILRKQWHEARRTLLLAYLERRRQKLTRHKFELHFHLAYHYVLRGQTAKAWTYMAAEPDTTYHMVLYREEFKTQRGSGIATAKNYLWAARSTGLTQGKNPQRANAIIFYFNFHRQELRASGKPAISLARHKLIARLLELLVLNHCGLSKEDILRQVFGFNHYEPDLHDQKVYMLVWKTHRLLGHFGVITADSNGYRLNSAHVYLNEGAGARLEQTVNFFHNHVKLS